MNESVSDTEEIFWGDLVGDDLAFAITERFDGYLEELEARGRLRTMRESARRYFGANGKGGYGSTHRLDYGGEQGELILVNVNHYRSLIRAIRSLAAASRPAYKATALQDDAESMKEVLLADQITAYDLDNGLEKALEECEERMLVYGEGAFGCFWDFDRGDIVDVAMDEDEETGEVIERPVYEGGPVWEAFSPHDVARPLDYKGTRDLPWVIVRRHVNRWDLAARYPDRLAEIHAAQPEQLEKERVWITRELRHMERETSIVLELYMKPSPAKPLGMFARVVEGKLLDPAQPLPYKRIPVKIAVPAHELDEATGYSDAWDLMGLCEAYDALMVNMLTTADQSGTPNFQSGKDDDIDVDDVPGGGRHVKWNRQGGGPPPGWLDPPKLDEGQVKLMQIIQEDLKMISGVNSTVRGDPQASLKSGSALAMVSAMAVQYSSALQSAIADLRRDAATLNLENYQLHARTERVIEIVGSEHTGTAASFTSESLQRVRRIRVELTNPLMRTVAGKKELAEFLADPQRFGADKPMTREQFVSFLETGRFEPLYRQERSSALGLKAENEQLSQGQIQPVLKYDHHANHILEHKALLDGRQRMAMSDDALNVVLEHIDTHMAEWARLTNEEPAVLIVTGQDPYPFPQPMMPPAGPPGPDGAPAGPPGPGGGPPPPGPAPDAPTALNNPEVSMTAMGQEMLPGTNPAAAGQQAPRMPRMPNNPLTGDRMEVGT